MVFWEIKTELSVLLLLFIQSKISPNPCGDSFEDGLFPDQTQITGTQPLGFLLRSRLCCNSFKLARHHLLVWVTPAHFFTIYERHLSSTNALFKDIFMGDSLVFFQRIDTSTLFCLRTCWILRCKSLENKLMVTSGEGWLEGLVREFGIDVYTLLYLKWKTNSRITYYIAQGALFNVMWQPGWEGRVGENGYMDIMAESFCCLLETITTLLISYTPV